MDAEFHVVQWCTFWAFVRREPQCFLVSSHLGETCSRVSQRFTPCCQRLFPARQSRSQRSHPNTGNFQFPTGSPPLAASLIRPWMDPCVSVFLAHLWLLQRVPRFPSLVVQLISPCRETTASYCARKAIKASSILWQAHSFDGSVFDSVLAHKCGATNINNLCRVPVRTKPGLRASGGTTQQSKDKALFKTMATSF